MKIACTILITFFLLSSCKKNNTLIDLIISFKCSIPVEQTGYRLIEDDQYFYYPDFSVPSNSDGFPDDSLTLQLNNTYQGEVTIDYSNFKIIEIYTAIETQHLNNNETASYEITIIDQDTGEIKYEQKAQTAAKYNRELIQL